MSKRIPLSIFILVLIASMLVCSLAGCVGGLSIFKDNEYGDITNNGDDTSEHSKLDLIIRLFEAYSYYEIDEEDLCRAFVEGIPLAIEDRYAAYYNAEEYALMTAENSGESQGIGVTVIENTTYNCIEIVSVLPNSPALAAGVEPGDLIIYIGAGENRESVSELGYNVALTKLQGEKGTVAEFTVARGENYSEEVEFSITRDKFTTESVTYHVCETNSKVGIIKLIQFDLTTPAQFCTAMDALIAAGVESFIFDVRYNPGGDLASITAVLSFMLNEGDVLIRTLDRAGTEVVTKVGVVNQPSSSPYSACNVSKDDIGKYRKYVEGKSAILTNGSTASAAELFTSALMDYKISKIVGTTTYGKGSMQSIIPLAYYGFDGAVKMTTKKYFPPLSEGYDGIGIKPDVEVELDEALKNKNIYKITDAEDNQLQAAVSALGH